MKLSALTVILRQKLAAYHASLRPFTWNIRRELPPHLTQIQAASTELDSAMKEIEARFLEISNTIESTTTTGQELVEHGEALIALALGQGGGQIIIETTAEHIWGAVEFVERNVQDSENLILELGTASGQISKSLATEEALARTLAPLTYVQSLFRVESAGLTPELQTMFHALVSDIERVRQTVESGFREKFQLIRDIQQILNRAIAQLNHRAATAKKAVSDLRASLTKSLAEMKESYEKNRDRDTRLAEVSQSVTRETGRVVISLQFFDAFTQRLQHARVIQKELETTITNLPSERTAACRSLRIVEQAGQICGAQLGAMNSELIQAGEIVSAGMQEIMRQMAALDDDCVALRDLDNVTTGFDGAVQILLDSLSDVQGLVGEAENFAMESHKAIAPVGGMTTNFTRFIHNLSYEIQLIGLNAEVQSAHIGQGTGLDVLSAQTSAISRETNLLNTKLAVELDSLTSGLDTMVGSFRDIRDRSVTFNQTLRQEAAEHQHSLHDYRDSALKVLHHIGELLPKLETQLRSATEQANFVSDATEPLVSLQDAMMGISGAAKAAANKSKITVETAGLTDHFLKIYTMKSETDAHHQALGRMPTATPASPTSAAPANGEMDFFGDDAPAPASATTSTPTPSGEIDLFGDEPAAPANPPVTNPLADVTFFTEEAPPVSPDKATISPEVPVPPLEEVTPEAIAPAPPEPRIEIAEGPTILTVNSPEDSAPPPEVVSEADVWVDPPAASAEPQSAGKKRKKKRSA